MKKIVLIFGVVILLIYSCQNKKQTVAIIDGKEITLTDIDKVIDKQLFQLLEGVYILRKETLEEMLRDNVFRQEAQKRGLTADQLFEKEIMAKLTDSLILKKANEIKWVIADRSDPFKAYNIKTAFGRMYFKESLALLYKRKYADSLMNQHKVKILLSPPDQIRPKVNLSGVNIHYEGNLHSDNTIVLIGNPDCDGCRQLNPVVDSLYKKYSSQFKFGYVFFDNIVSLSALALEGAVAQNNFLNMQRILYKRPMQPDTISLLNMAYQVKLDTLKLHKFINNRKSVVSIEKNIAKLQKLGFYTTPVIIINNNVFSAPFKYEDLDNYLTKLIN